EMGVKLVSDLRELSRERLMNTLGPKTGEKLYQYARGIDNTELGQEPPRKSISAEINWGIRFKNDQEAEDFVRNLCGELHRRCVEHGSRGSLFTMRLMRRAAGAPMEPAKHGGHGPCDTLNKSIKLGVPTNDPAILAREAVSILRGFAGDPRDIRGLGVQLTKLEPIKQIVGQYFRDSQRKLDFSRKPAHAPITPRKENRLRDALQDPDEIESPQKGEALPEGVPEANEALNDPTKKKLNITGNQFILPPEQDGKKEEPKLIPTVPGDILSQLRKQPRRESSGEANASAVEDDSELARKSMQRPPTKPPLRRDLDPSKKPVSLPPKSELDLSVLSELPEDIREEYLRQYSLPQHGSTRNTTVRQDPGGGQLKLGETMKHKSRKVHPAAWARYNKNITLTQTVFRPPSSQEEKFADTVHKPDPEVLQALPPHIQAEVIRESKIKEQEARLRYRRRLNYKPSPPPDRSPDHKFVVSPRRPAIPIFTSAGLTKVPEIRERLSEWFKGYKPDGPYQEDTDILCNYLKDVVLVERDMAKAVAVANWLAWLVKDGFAGDELGELEGHLARRDENANRHNGFLEGRDGERHDAGEMSDEELLRTSESWRQTVLQVKTAINDAVKQRGLGEVSFAL
ncbi:deoxycytidyl transferase, partial [Ascosphaera atra]